MVIFAIFFFDFLKIVGFLKKHEVKFFFSTIQFHFLLLNWFSMDFFVSRKMMWNYFWLHPWISFLYSVKFSLSPHWFVTVNCDCLNYCLGCSDTYLLNDFAVNHGGSGHQHSGLVETRWLMLHRGDNIKICFHLYFLFYIVICYWHGWFPLLFFSRVPEKWKQQHSKITLLLLPLKRERKEQPREKTTTDEIGNKKKRCSLKFHLLINFKLSLVIRKSWRVLFFWFLFVNVFIYLFIVMLFLINLIYCRVTYEVW